MFLRRDSQISNNWWFSLINFHIWQWVINSFIGIYGQIKSVDYFFHSCRPNYFSFSGGIGLRFNLWYKPNLQIKEKIHMALNMRIQKVYNFWWYFCVNQKWLHIRSTQQYSIRDLVQSFAYLTWKLFRILNFQLVHSNNATLHIKYLVNKINTWY